MLFSVAMRKQRDFGDATLEHSYPNDNISFLSSNICSNQIEKRGGEKKKKGQRQRILEIKL